MHEDMPIAGVCIAGLAAMGLIANQQAVESAREEFRGAVCKDFVRANLPEYETGLTTAEHRGYDRFSPDKFVKVNYDNDRSDYLLCTLFSAENGARRALPTYVGSKERHRQVYNMRDERCEEVLSETDAPNIKLSGVESPAIRGETLKCMRETTDTELGVTVNQYYRIDTPGEVWRVQGQPLAELNSPS